MLPINNERLANLAGVHYDSEEIQPGPIVYSRTHTAVKQFDKLATFGPCNLVTSFSDASVTDEMAAKLPENVRFWFTNNVATTDPRVIAVPIGLRYSRDIEDEWLRQRGEMRDDTFPLMVCHSEEIPRDPNPRAGLKDRFVGYDWVNVFDSLPVERFYQAMRAHSYVLSPPGAGPDCHRHWEAIGLGCIPIVLQSRATDLLKGLPCLRVQDWGDISEDTLALQLPQLRRRFQWSTMQRLDFNFWAARIKGDFRLVSCGVPRTGSTLTWQIASQVLGEPVQKIHPAEYEPDGSWVLATVRHPLDTAASRYRFRLCRSPGDTSEAVAGWPGLHTELMEMRKHFHALAAFQDYQRLVVLRYEDFFGNYECIYNALEGMTGRPVYGRQREAITRDCGLAANRERSQKPADFQRYQIHPGHVGAAVPGTWRDVIPEQFHTQTLEFCEDICEAWGYTA